jgi:hypothetical protein
MTGYYAVAGDDDRQGIFSQRLSHGADGGWLANLPGYPAVASSSAVRDKSGCRPYPLLKVGRPGQVESVGESRFMTAEVNPEAPDKVLE